MKNLIKFLSFIIYSTCIFFLPNNKLIIVFIAINAIAMIFVRKNIKNIMINTMKILPFIIFTFVINCILDNYTNATWIGIKLIIVCNITFVYSSTTTVTRHSRNRKTIMHTT